MSAVATPKKARRRVTAKPLDLGGKRVFKDKWDNVFYIVSPDAHYVQEYNQDENHKRESGYRNAAEVKDYQAATELTGKAAADIIAAHAKAAEYVAPRASSC